MTQPNQAPSPSPKPSAEPEGKRPIVKGRAAIVTQLVSRKRWAIHDPAFRYWLTTEGKWHDITISAMSREDDSWPTRADAEAFIVANTEQPTREGDEIKAWNDASDELSGKICWEPADQSQPASAVSAAAAPQEDERKGFEALNEYLDYTRREDSWGREIYKHECIQVAWEAWQARGKVQAASPRADGVVWSNPATDSATVAADEIPAGHLSTVGIIKLREENAYLRAELATAQEQRDAAVKECELVMDALDKAGVKREAFQRESESLDLSPIQRVQQLVAKLTAALAAQSEAEKERDEAKSDHTDFLAFMAGHLAEWPCMHDPGSHDGTPPVCWPELIACIVQKAKSELEQQVTDLTRQLEEAQPKRTVGDGLIQIPRHHVMAENVGDENSPFSTFVGDGELAIKGRVYLDYGIPDFTTPAKEPGP